jgi:hypothetical protein
MIRSNGSSRVKTENTSDIEETRGENQRSLLDVSKIKGPRKIKTVIDKKGAA